MHQIGTWVLSSDINVLRGIEHVSVDKRTYCSRSWNIHIVSWVLQAQTQLT